MIINEEKESFSKWFLRFLEEKQIDLSEYLSESIQVGDVCQFILNTSPDEKKKIQDTLIVLDFKNGNINHYFKHLSQAITPEMIKKEHSEIIEQILGRVRITKNNVPKC